jgi:hypothetical protein
LPLKEKAVKIILKIQSFAASSAFADNFVAGSLLKKNTTRKSQCGFVKHIV